MKKLLGTLLLFFLLSNNANSNDKFIGKWISINTGSLFEIIRLDNSYEVYMLYRQDILENMSQLITNC